MTFKDPATNEYKGFEIEIVEELAKDMGVKLVIVPTEWKTLVNGIVSNKYDISTSASLSAKRALSTGYTDSYFKLATVPLALKKNLNQFTSWEDINHKNIKVAVVCEDSKVKEVKDAGADIVGAEDLMEIVQEVYGNYKKDASEKVSKKLAVSEEPEKKSRSKEDFASFEDF